MTVENGAALPPILAGLVENEGDERVSLPDVLAGGWGVLLLYRGHW